MQGIFITTKNLRKKNIKKFLLFFIRIFKKIGKYPVSTFNSPTYSWLNDMIPILPLKDSDCRSGNLILQILWSCVHAEEKHRLNRLFSGNLLLYQNKTMQFSGLPLRPLVREGCSTVRTIAGRFSGSLRHSSNIFYTHRSSVVTNTPSTITGLPGNSL